MPPPPNQISGAPRSSLTGAASETVAPPSQTHPRSERVLARGPFWARLPALRTMTEIVRGSQSQDQDARPAAPPIVLSDRVSTTRILLTDTQACMQKLSARMDMIGSRAEQSLKEIQLAREAMNASSESTVADVSDIVFKCQAALTKSIETRDGTLDQIRNDIARLTTANDALVKLYEAQSASLASVTEIMHGVMASLQSSQTHHSRMIGTLSPLEPLVRSIPSHVDAILPALERTIERTVEYAFTKPIVAAYMRRQDSQALQTPRGQKRKHSLERRPSDDSLRVRRKSTMVRPDALRTCDPSSPLAGRRQSKFWSNERLHSRASSKRVAEVIGATSEINVEAVDEAPTAQTIAAPFLRRTTGRSTSGFIGTPPPGQTSYSIMSTGTVGDSITSPQVIAGSTPSTVLGANAKEVAPTRGITRSAAEADTVHPITAFCVTLGNQQSPYVPVNNGVTSVDTVGMHDAMTSAHGSENVGPVPINDKANNASSKNKSKAPRKRGQTKATGTRKAKSTPSTAVLADTSLSIDPQKGEPSKETSPKRTTTDDSNASLVSVVLVHGLPNSPSIPANLIPLALVEGSDASERKTSEQIPLPNGMPLNTMPNIASRARALISLTDASQESSLLAGHCDGPGLSAALAHIDNDINFASIYPLDSTQREDSGILTTQNAEGVNVTNGLRKQDGPSSEGGRTLVKGRPRRLLVRNNESGEFDFLGLFAE